jgi:sodium-dependent dicarboxylate transporter 2/3/5
VLTGFGLPSTRTVSRGTLPLVAGPLLALAIMAMPLPAGMSESARRAGAVASLMAVWWVTEAVPIAATALVPIVLFPLLGVLAVAETCAAYADPTNLFFLGGLMLAAGIERWNLHRRLALHVMARIGGSPRQIVLGFLMSTAAVSMWTSNAATSMMMLPIALAVLQHFEDRGVDTRPAFAPALMLTVAYGASIGGVGTLVGTPPNVIFVGALHRLFPQAPPVGFGAWMLLGVPVVAVMVPVTWLWLTRVAFRVPATMRGDDAADMRAELAALGPMRPPERRVLVVFATAVFLWVSRADLNVGSFVVPGWSRLFPNPTAVNDTIVAIGMALLLFVIPSGEGDEQTLLGADWPGRVPWGVLVLLGGGFALAAGMESSGLALWLAQRLTDVGRLPTPVLVVSVTALLTFLTEFTSNTALATLMMPVLAATAVGTHVDPRLLMVPATFAASFGFMMPGGTAPNAIVFASGRVTVAQMVRAGAALDVIGIVVVTLLFYVLGLFAFGITPGVVPAWLE